MSLFRSCGHKEEVEQPNGDPNNEIFVVVRLRAIPTGI